MIDKEIAARAIRSTLPVGEAERGVLLGFLGCLSNDELQAAASEIEEDDGAGAIVGFLQDMRRRQAEAAAAAAVAVASTSGGGIPQDLLDMAARFPLLEQRVESLSVSTEIVNRVLVYNEDAATRGSNLPFKTSLLKEFRIPQRRGAEGTSIQCMLTKSFLPSRVVIASHIVKHSWDGLGIHSLLGMEVDDVGNGLLLFKPIEWALDNSKVCFTYDERFGDFTMRILDPALKAKTLLSVLEEPPSERLRNSSSDLSSADWKVLRREVKESTFEDLEGHWPQLQPGAKRPFKRALCFHARRARSYALQQQWIGEGDVIFDDFWSEGDYKANVERWLATLP